MIISVLAFHKQSLNICAVPMRFATAFNAPTEEETPEPLECGICTNAVSEFRILQAVLLFGILAGRQDNRVLYDGQIGDEWPIPNLFGRERACRRRRLSRRAPGGPPEASNGVLSHRKSWRSRQRCPLTERVGEAGIGLDESHRGCYA
jgi:hypothetical protein